MAKTDPAIIMKAYNEQKGQPGFDLKKFVFENFAIPGAHNGGFQSDNFCRDT